MSMINALTTAIVAALQEAPAVAPRVDRVRLRPLPAGATTAVVVRPLQADVLDSELTGQGYPYQWQTSIAVECYARAPAGVSPDVAVDALVEAVYSRLLSASLPVSQLQPQGVAFDYDADGENTVCATFQFTARQLTVGASLS